MRHEGRKKMGFYKTPVSVAKRIKSFVNFNSVKNSILDPCCGEGEFAGIIAENTNAETFGIELDGYRAEQAKKVINHLLKSDFANTRISNNSFNLLLLNPPYDDEYREDGSCTRKEKIFLVNSVKYLQSEGLLIYIIQQRRLDESIAKILSYRFENIIVYRFQDGEYETFRQIIVFGTKKRKNFINGDTFAYLKRVPFADLKEIPISDTHVYQLPKGNTVSLFKSTEIDAEELEKEIKGSSLWSRFRNMVIVPEHTLGSPPLPVRIGHVASLLLSGQFDGVVGEGANKHLVRGKVEKVTTSHEEVEEKVTVMRETEKFKFSARILKQTGELVSLT